MFISFVLFMSFAISVHPAQIRGVNLGGWLVLEPWITPSLFEPFVLEPFSSRAIDEFSFNKRLGPSEAKRKLEEHWSSFIAETDFKAISNFGLTHVRIPFGWWIFGDSADYVHNLTYLDLAVEWAEKYNLKILLDLHGAPGSQNGFDCSGLACNDTYFNLVGSICATDCPSSPEWLTKASNLLLTQQILLKIAQRYQNNPVIWGISLVNEPLFGSNNELLKEWMDETYHVLEKIVPQWKILMDLTFLNFPELEPKPFPPNVLPKWHEYNDHVLFDHHIYLWPFGLDKTPEEIIDYSCEYLEKYAFLAENKELKSIVGEWSLGFDDCAKWLLGFMSTPIKEKLFPKGCERNLNSVFFQEFAKNQLWLFEKTEGWFFWTYKTELEDEWSWVKLVENGWVPKDAKEIADYAKDSRCEKIKNEL